MDGDIALGTYRWQFLAVPAPIPERLIGSDPDFYFTYLLDRWAGRPDALDCGHFIAEEEPEACAAARRDLFLETRRRMRPERNI